MLSNFFVNKKKKQTALLIIRKQITDTPAERDKQGERKRAFRDIAFISTLKFNEE